MPSSRSMKTAGAWSVQSPSPVHRSWSIHTFTAQAQHSPAAAHELDARDPAVPPGGTICQNRPRTPPARSPPIDTYRETDEALDERDLQVGARSIAGPWRWTGFVAALLIAASAPIWHLAGNEWRLT